MLFNHKVNPQCLEVYSYIILFVPTSSFSREVGNGKRAVGGSAEQRFKGTRAAARVEETLAVFNTNFLK